MKKDGDNDDKYVCDDGETVTFTFTETGTTFLVSEDFEKPVPPPGVLTAKVLTFPVNKSDKVRLHIDYDFNAAVSFYDVTIKGQTGKTFKRKINSTFNSIHPTRRTYEFRVL